MKNIFVIITILLFASIACNDDYLEKFPPYAVTDMNFWNDANDIKMYANQFYPQLQHKTLFCRSDDDSDNNGPSGSRRPLYQWNQSPVPSSGGGWGKADWLQIRRCNYALARIEKMEQTTVSRRYEAEIRFFKAWFYFDKVRQFGDVPWLEKDLRTDSEELFGPRESRETVVAKILADLDFAVEHLPETDGELRLTRYAALAFKTNVALYEGTFSKYRNLANWQPLLQVVVDASEGLINSGLFDIHSTGNQGSDYFNLFISYDLTSNPEAIFMQQFISDVRTHNTNRLMGEPQTGFTKDYVNSFLCTDGLPIALSPIYQGDNQWGDEFINRDPRMDQQMYNGLSGRPYRIYPDGEIWVRDDDPLFDAVYGNTGYKIIKYYDPNEFQRFQHQSTNDQFIMRYGTVLLNYAEAKYELGEIDQTVLDITINKLRDRVGMPHLTVDVGFTDPNWPAWETPVSPLLNEIRRERRIEIPNEGLRWHDIVRWKAGKLLENPLTFMGARDPGTGAYRVLYPGLTRIWDDKLYLRPLPLNDLALNPNLTQNPGW